MMRTIKRILAFCLAAAALLCLPVRTHAVSTPPVRIDDTTIEMISLPEGGLNDILKEYLEIVRNIQAEVKENHTEFALTGTLRDLNRDGLPELFLSYEKNTNYTSGPNVGIYATIVIPAGSKCLQKITHGFGDVTCGECGIYLGMIDKTQVVHCIYAYTAQDSPRTYGWDSVFRLSDQGLEPVMSLNWNENQQKQEFHYFVDGIENEKEWMEIMDGVEEMILQDFPVNDMEELKYLIAHYNS